MDSKYWDPSCVCEEQSGYCYNMYYHKRKCYCKSVLNGCNVKQQEFTCGLCNKEIVYACETCEKTITKCPNKNCCPSKKIN